MSRVKLLSVVWIILLILVALAFSCARAAPVVRQASSSPSAAPASVPLTNWINYSNSTFGLSFKYPSSMTLLVNEPDTSGIQLGNESLNVNIILNPEAPDSVEDFVLQLRNLGYKENRRTTVDKGRWKGLRLEGTARDGQTGYDFPETVYLVKSNDSLLVMLALWNEAPPNYQLVDTMWNSLELRLDSFVLSPALLKPESLTTFSSSDGKFSLRYPTHWQVRATSESSVYIFDPDDSEAFLMSVTRRKREGMGLSESVELATLLLRSGFGEINIETREPTSIRGAIESVQLSGSLTFNDGALGIFQTMVAISQSDIYTMSTILDTSRAPIILPVARNISESFTIN